ncbi:MAG: PVC-type heme-binding CxxCH protein [Verrucomicrobiota bacterium]
MKRTKSLALVLSTVFVFQLHGQISALKVPEGFSVERIAGSPLVEHPMLANFDDRGRLFVADSSGTNLPGEELLKNPPHSIRMLEDTNHDGIFDTSIVFADKMVIPQGVVWHNGSVYVSSPPNFWRLQDTNGDGVADKREILASGFALTGISDDMHGASLGPDGRIYWFAGRLPHEIKNRDGALLHQGRSPLMLRCKPDGSELEIVSGAHGNCVGAAFTLEGEPFACGTFFAPPAMGAGLRDAIIHVVEGAEYPVLDMVLHEHKRTGELMPPLTHLGVAAASGLAIYRGENFGTNFTGDLFSALFNMHKVIRHVMERDGATFKCRNEDFLTTTNSDFHPTDVLEDADGSLLVVDTGGWFLIGCPTSQIAKPDVKGAIYRIRRNGAPRVADARGLKIKWNSRKPAELAALLSDARFAVRDHAIQQLANLGNNSIATLSKLLNESKSVEAARNSIWTLTRIETKEAREAARLGLAHKSASVRQAAARSVGLHRDAEALPRLMEIVRTDTPPNRREAATALGRIRRVEAVPALLDGLRAVTDRFLEHALIFSLIQINDRAATLRGLSDTNSAVRRGALIALDQMDAGNLTPEMVVPFLNPADALLQETALWVVAHHPDWGGAMLGFFQHELPRENLNEKQRDDLKQQLLAFAKDAAIQQLIANNLRDEKIHETTRLMLLETIAQSPLNKLPAIWGEALSSTLTNANEPTVRQTIATIRSVPRSDNATNLENALLKIALNISNSSALRAESLAAAAPRVVELNQPLVEFLLTCLGKEKPSLLRITAAEALSKAPLNRSQLLALTRVLPTAGAIEMTKLLTAFSKSADGEVGTNLLAVLNQSANLSSLRADTLRKTLQKYPPEIQQAAEPLLKKISVDTEKQKQRLDELKPVLAGGDIQRGREIFFGNKASCSTCHSVQGAGGHVGPDLSKIAAIRAGPDLLEAIIFPSASFARGFESFLITTTDDEIQSGIIGRETAEAIYLYGAGRIETRIPRSSIKEIKQGAVSIMPEGLDAQLNRQELGDLIKFLLSLK